MADHLSRLGMGFPATDDLVEILKANFTPQEAGVALGIPSRAIPLQPVSVQEIARNVDVPIGELSVILKGLAQKGLLFAGETAEGEEGYALQQVGFSFPQTFFWRGEDTPHARNMASLIAKYFNRKVSQEAYHHRPDPYRYVPLSRTLAPEIQSVMPYHSMEDVLEQVTDFAVCHCSCRMIAKLRGNPCEHATEVCMKFDEMARYVIQRDLGRKISRNEAHNILEATEEAGLVHFVDNAREGIKHNCNCCGCACWNVGTIRRRKIPRDAIMAIYFLRETDENLCTGCGDCAERCPVNAITLNPDGRLVVDRDWCIGCGTCVFHCSANAAHLRVRPDRTGELPARRFDDLHRMILRQKERSPI